MQPEKLDIHSEAFLHTLMRRQLKLSIACAVTFLLALIGMPLANYFYPEVMATRVFGFTVSWLILGVLFFPFVWIISFVFIKRSMALEEAEVAEVEKHQTSNTKHQTDTKSQISNSGAALIFLVFGTWSFFGVWPLVVGV
jgi:uncharacterized membrane protein (DUF485 family)